MGSTFIYGPIYFNSSCKSKQSKINRVITLEIEESAFLHWLVTVRRLYLHKHLPWKLPGRPADGSLTSCVSRSRGAARAFYRLSDRRLRLSTPPLKSAPLRVHRSPLRVRSSLPCKWIPIKKKKKWSPIFYREDHPAKQLTPPSFGVSAPDSAGNVECIFFFPSAHGSKRLVYSWISGGTNGASQVRDVGTVPRLLSAAIKEAAAHLWQLLESCRWEGNSCENKCCCSAPD